MEKKEVFLHFLQIIVELEKQVLDYSSQQYRLFPWIASVFAINFAGQQLEKAYHSFLKESTQVQSEIIPVLHGVSSGLKIVVTQTVSEAIEQVIFQEISNL